MRRHKWIAKHLTHNHGNFAQKLNMQLQIHLENEVHKESNGLCKEEKFEFFLSRNCVKSSVRRGGVNSIDVNKNTI